MSDPVTHLEIEDVLSSIRKLVSEGEQARSRDSVPPEPETMTPADPGESRPAKLVLSPADLVALPEAEIVPAEPEVAISPRLSEILWEEAADAQQDEAPSEPTQATSAPDAAPDDPVSRRSALEATIAELEASVGGDGFEPDGSELVEPFANLVWPGSERRMRDDVEEAELSESDPAPSPDAVPDDPAPEPVQEDHQEDLTEDDDLEAFLQGAEGRVDDETLRKIVAAVVREELQGALGERITRNVRKLVRREIYRVLSSEGLD